MYLPDAKVIWNGNTVPPNPAALAPFLDGLPLSRHDLQSLDCHPMSGELAYEIKAKRLMESTCWSWPCTRYPTYDNWLCTPRSLHHRQLILGSERTIAQGQA